MTPELYEAIKARHIERQAYCDKNNVPPANPAHNDRASLLAYVEELRAEIEQLKELLTAARAGQPIGPIVGAQTIINQERTIREQAAEIERLRAEQEKE